MVWRSVFVAHPQEILCRWRTRANGVNVPSTNRPVLGYQEYSTGRCWAYPSRSKERCSRFQTGCYQKDSRTCQSPRCCLQTYNFQTCRLRTCRPHSPEPSRTPGPGQEPRPDRRQPTSSIEASWSHQSTDEGLGKETAKSQGPENAETTMGRRLLLRRAELHAVQKDHVITAAWSTWRVRFGTRPITSPSFSS